MYDPEPMATAEATIKFKRKKLKRQTLMDLYTGMLKSRLIEEKMLKLLRQGKITKWFSGIGQEAISTGVTLALAEDELIFPMHRNLGVFTNRNVPLHRLFAQWQGKASGYTKGRDRSFHFGTLDHAIVGMISHLGPQLALACGAALAYKLEGLPKVAVAFTGEGGTSEGDFHEAMNVAAVWDLPVLFVIENNGYGLSTPTSEQYKCKSLADKGVGYGMKAVTIDGNNVLEVYETVRRLVGDIRKQPVPVMLECMTFRRRGHEEASGTRYVPKELMAHWELRDPVDNYEQFLLDESVLAAKDVEQHRAQIIREIESALPLAFDEPEVHSTPEAELNDVYDAPGTQVNLPNGDVQPMRFVDAIRDGLDVAMHKYDNLVLMGQDIAAYGGVFKVTEGLAETYGVDRVRNTPLCESAIIGVALGLSIQGFKSMVEMQFADFVTCGFNQIVNNLAKVHYRWQQNADVVIRMPTGGGVGAGPFHSQSTEAWFFHVPGLKIVYPSNPYDAKGLLLAAFEDRNPVLYFEHKALYRNSSGDVPTGHYTVPLGVADIVRTGNDVTIITYGMGVRWCTEIADEIAADVEIIDLRSLTPLDYDTIDQSVQKTGRVLIAHEATRTGGIGAEISAEITERLFEYLDAPVLRVASLDTPVPFAHNLEQQFLPRNRIKEQIEQLLSY